MDNKNYTLQNHPNLKDKYFVFTLILMTFHLLANALWIYLNKNPLDFDPIGHTFASLNSALYLKVHLLHGFNLGEFMKISPGYPNFVHVSSLPLIFLFGASWKVIQFTGTVFFLLAIFFLFLYVRIISRNSKIAFFSAFFYSFFISIVQYSRWHMLDIPLTAMIVLTLFFWEKFKANGKYLYFYAGVITAGLAQITKWHAFIFLLIPGLFLLFYLYKSKKLFSGKFILHLLFSALILIIIVVPWYYYNFDSFIKLGLINYKGESDDPQKIFSLANVLYYPKVIINFQTHFLGFLFIIFSCLGLKIGKRKYLVLPLLTLIFAYFFFTFFVINKNIRVLFPIMPFIALIMAVGVEEAKNFLLKFFAWGVIAYMVAASLILSFGFPIKPDIKTSYNFPVLGWIDTIYLSSYPVDLLYSARPIAYDEIINDLVLLSNSKGPLKALVGVHLLSFNKGSLGLVVYDQKRDNKIKLFDPGIIIDDYAPISEILRSYDVILTTENNPINKEEVLNPLYKPLKNIQGYLLGANNSDFVRLSSYSLPDGDRLIIFSRL